MESTVSYRTPLTNDYLKNQFSHILSTFIGKLTKFPLLIYKQQKQKSIYTKKTVYLYDKILLCSNKFATHSCQNRQQRHFPEIRTPFIVNHKMNFLLYFLAWLRRNQTSYVIHLTRKTFQNHVIIQTWSYIIYSFDIHSSSCVVFLPWIFSSVYTL